MRNLLILAILPLALSAETFPMAFYKPPSPLPDKAVVEDWPRFFGPRDNCTTNEGPLLKTFPETGLPIVFELDRGDSYSSPILVDGKLLHFHAVNSAETLDYHDAETGKRIWTFSRSIKYRDRYGFSSGPRSSPVVHQGKIYLVGVTAMLHCLDLKTGKPLWKRDLMEEFQIPKYFFGYGPNPVVHGEHLILNLGGREKKTSGTCVVALHLKDGTTAWTHEDSWGASYASPIITRLHGKEVALVLAAGESKPPTGGLLILDPTTGKLHSRFPWRADIYESVLASTPLALPGNQVFISDCYQLGGVLLQFDKDLKATPVWKERFFGMHMMIPQVIDSHLYGFAGRNIPDTQLKGINISTGKITWEDDMRWTEDERVTGLFRGSFLRAGKRIFALGEDGSFAEVQLTPKKSVILQKTRLFYARETWTPPVIHRGLLYIAQNTKGFDGSTKKLICYDLRPRT
ncbi:MAG: outer membrane protein assembly factor BamB [Paracoccaceae bacterium]|jgi:outer membrane protein assembly factor BamB